MARTYVKPKTAKEKKCMKKAIAKGFELTKNEKFKTHKQRTAVVISKATKKCMKKKPKSKR